MHIAGENFFFLKYLPPKFYQISELPFLILLCGGFVPTVCLPRET